MKATFGAEFYANKHRGRRAILRHLTGTLCVDHCGVADTWAEAMAAAVVCVGQERVKAQEQERDEMGGIHHGENK